jgi:hypothetical protein
MTEDKKKDNSENFISNREEMIVMCTCFTENVLDDVIYSVFRICEGEIAEFSICVF